MRRHPTAAPAGPFVRTASAAIFGGTLLAAICLAAWFGGPARADGESCPNAAVRAQQGAQALPECRAYEMVSPPQKNNGEVRIDAVTRAALDGNGLEFEAAAPFAGAEGASHINQYVSWRSASGWTTESLTPALSVDFLAGVGPNEGYAEFTPNLTTGVLVAGHDPNDRSGDNSEDQKRLYLRTKGVSAFAQITPTPVSLSPFAVPSRAPEYGGSSTDMSRVFAESNEAQLTAEAPGPEIREAYEWHDGQFTLIGRLPNGEIAPEGARIGFGAGESPDSREAVSGDGTQVVLTMSSPSQLYLRENGQSQLISGSQVSGEEGTPAPHGATFMGSSSEDGKKLSEIYFASPDKLTDDAVAAPESGPAADELYAYDVRTGELSFLSKRTNPSARESAEVYPRWIAASKDGSYVYFIASGLLTPGSAGKEIYLWHDGAVRGLGPVEHVPNYNANLNERNRARISTDGKRLLLLTGSPHGGAGLTADSPPCVGLPGTSACPEEVYFYDAPTDHWTCLSCNPSGPTTGNGGLKSALLTGYSGLAGQPYRSLNLTPDGSRAFFEAEEALVPGDTNGTWDVYEWHEGQINLLSTGRAPEGSTFLDASPDGKNVFIATRERLVSEDTDNLTDVYDVRVDGGFLDSPKAPACEGDACQGAPGTAPSTANPSSSELSGAGNVKEGRKPRCTPARKAKKGAMSTGSRTKAKSSCAKPRPAKKKHATKKKHKASAKGKGGKR